MLFFYKLITSSFSKTKQIQQPRGEQSIWVIRCIEDSKCPATTCHPWKMCVIWPKRASNLRAQRSWPIPWSSLSYFPIEAPDLSKSEKILDAHILWLRENTCNHLILQCPWGTANRSQVSSWQSPDVAFKVFSNQSSIQPLPTLAGM